MNWHLFHRGKPPVTAERTAPRVLGLALGGGAVRGAAHLGVLSVFELEGIRPDVVAGTSIGAIVGAWLAAGVTPAEMLAQFGKAKWTTIARPSRGSKLGTLNTNSLATMFGEIMSARTFDELELPFAAVASDILTGTRVFLTEGPLAEAVVASSALPAIFEPVRRDGRLLVDGGLTDNLPVDAAHLLGADYVIAVDIMPPLDGSYEPTDRRDMVMLSWNIVQRDCEHGRGDADLVITPDVVRVSLSDFSQMQEAYDAGVAAAEAALPTLLEDLRR